MSGRGSLLAGAVGGILALAGGPAAAAGDRPVDTEMCFRYNLAQDCGWNPAGCGGSAFGSACGGSPERNRSPGRWKMVPAGTCERVHGGTRTPPDSYRENFHSATPKP